MDDMLENGLVLDDYIDLQFIKKVEALTGITEYLRSEQMVAGYSHSSGGN